MSDPLRIVILGLSITSSRGNGHATTYRALVRELDARGHDVLFLERDAAWYADKRDLPQPPYGRTERYSGLEELRERFGEAVRGADAVIVGSCVPDGIAVGDWVQSRANGITAFYDLDTPVTLADLAHGDCGYLNAFQVPRYDLYLSCTGGPTLDHLEHRFGAPRARALYGSADPDLYYPEQHGQRWDLGYLGTYAEDRQPSIDALLNAPAARWPEGRFVVAGPSYPETIAWPDNVERIDHLPAAAEYRRFFNSQRATLDADRVPLGWTPSMRLFEAAACATPIISDGWPGLDEVLTPGREVLIARNADEVLVDLRRRGPEALAAIGRNARRRVLAEHTAGHRAEQLEGYLHATAPGRISAQVPPRRMEQVAAGAYG